MILGDSVGFFTNGFDTRFHTFDPIERIKNSKNINSRLSTGLNKLLN